MSDAIKVLITLDFGDAIIQKLREISPRLEIISRPARTYSDISATVWQEAEILYTLGVYPPADTMPKLKWVQSHSAGVDKILTQPFLQSHPEIIVTSTRGIHATKMAEYIIGMCIALGHKFPQMRADFLKKEWSPDRHEKFTPFELRGATIGIVGYGAIGREVARLAKCFGMGVLASKRNVKEVEETDHYAPEGTGDKYGNSFDRLYPPQALATMVRDCDFVVITTPLTEKTRNLYDEKIIQAMRPGSYLVNVGRGGVLDEKALVHALKSGHLAGAALDVFETEPLPEDHPLWNAPNIVITPHIAGGMLTYHAKAAEIFEENLQRYLEKKPLLNVVDRTEGY